MKYMSNPQEDVEGRKLNSSKSDSKAAIFQSCPFFFTRNGASLNLTGIYRAGAAFLIGGGPSFATVDKRKLDSVWTMTLNNSVSSYRGNAACMVDDPARFNYSMWVDPKIQKFIPLSALEKPLWDNRALLHEGEVKHHWEPAKCVAGDCPNVIAYRRNELFDAAKFLYEETINWGCHAKYGGGRSVMLPALKILFLLGFRRVYLLGVDFEMAEDKKYHFSEDRPAPAIRANMETYARLKKWFSELQPHFLDEGFVVQNCNPASKLEAFPFIGFDDAIKDAMRDLGEAAQERTAGMYRKFEDKLADARISTPANSQSVSENSISASQENYSQPRHLILRNFQSPGDIVMLTAALRDLHLNHPGKFLTDVRTSCPQLWENNPYITSLDENDPWVEVIDCEYPLIHESNTGPWHFIHGFTQFLEDKVGVTIRPTKFRGDIHLSNEEKEWMSQVQQITEEPIPFWIIAAGGKRDFTIKWWDIERFQAVVDHFRGRILFVQIGEAGHEHRPLRGVLDLRGETDLRQLVRLVYHAQGIISPVTLLMHLGAAVETRKGMPVNRPCVIVAGGREPSQWEAYPHHQFIHTNGALSCCDNGGCWKSRTVPLDDGDEKDRLENLCRNVVYRSGSQDGEQKNAFGYSKSDWPDLMPRCMHMISSEEVIRRIELYFSASDLQFLNEKECQICNSALQRYADKI